MLRTCKAVASTFCGARAPQASRPQPAAPQGWDGLGPAPRKISADSNDGSLKSRGAFAPEPPLRSSAQNVHHFRLTRVDISGLWKERALR